MSKRTNRIIPEPTPKRHPNGSWYVRFELPHLPGQPRRRQSFYGQSTDEALEAWRKWARQHPSVGTRDENPDRKLAEVLDDWLTAKESGEAAVRVSSWTPYEQHVRLHIVPYLGGVRLRDLTVPDVDDWLAHLRASGMTGAMRRKVLGTLRRSIKWALRGRRDLANVAADAGMPPKPRAEKWHPIADAEVDRIVAAVKEHRLAPFFLMGLMLGPRMGEITGLWWSDVDRERRTIEIGHTLSWVQGMRREETKTEAGQRTLRLPDSLWDLLMEWEARQKSEKASRLAKGLPWLAGEEPYIFTRSTGAPLRGDGTGGVLWMWKHLLRKAGLAPMKFHATRHHAASLLLSLNGNNLVEVGQILGHSTYKVTADLYAHLRNEVADKLAALVDEYYRLRAINGMLAKTAATGPSSELPGVEQGVETLTGGPIRA